MDERKEKLLDSCKFVNDFFIRQGYDVALTSLINLAIDLGIINNSGIDRPYISPIQDLTGFGVADVLLSTLASSRYEPDISDYNWEEIFERESISKNLPEKDESLEILFKNLASVALQPDLSIAYQVSKVLIDFAVNLDILDEDCANLFTRSLRNYYKKVLHNILPYNKHIIRFQDLWERTVKCQEESRQK